MTTVKIRLNTFSNDTAEVALTTLSIAQIDAKLDAIQVEYDGSQEALSGASAHVRAQINEYLEELDLKIERLQAHRRVKVLASLG